MFKGIALYETSRKSCLSFVLKYAIHKMVMNIEKKMVNFLTPNLLQIPILEMQKKQSVARHL